MSFARQVPIQHPFSREPIRFASVPQVDAPIPANRPEANRVITQVSFVIDASGALTAFPNGTRLISLPFTNPVGIVAVSLSSSVVNASSTAVIAIWVAKDTGAAQNLQQDSDAMVEHIINRGLSHSFRSGIAYSDDIAPKYGSGEAMAIYACSSGTGSASNFMAAIATVRFFPLS